MILTPFCSKNSRLSHPVLKSLVNRCSVSVSWPYFGDFKNELYINVVFSKTQTCTFLLLTYYCSTDSADYSIIRLLKYVFKILKETQMSGHVKKYPETPPDPRGLTHKVLAHSLRDSLQCALSQSIHSHLSDSLRLLSVRLSYYIFD